MIICDITHQTEIAGSATIELHRDGQEPVTVRLDLSPEAMAALEAQDWVSLGKLAAKAAPLRTPTRAPRAPHDDTKPKPKASAGTPPAKAKANSKTNGQLVRASTAQPQPADDEPQQVLPVQASEPQVVLQQAPAPEPAQPIDKEPAPAPVDLVAPEVGPAGGNGTTDEPGPSPGQKDDAFDAMINGPVEDWTFDDEDEFEDSPF
jgi:hypothetical protein